MPIKFTNFANSRLAVGVGSGDVTLAVTGGQGARFPTLGAGDYFFATIENASLQREIVRVTARTGDTLTVVRGQDNTTAQAWNAGDSITLRFNAAAIEDSLGGTVLTSGNQTIAGTKTFSSPIAGDLTGNAGTVTDGVYLSTAQTITGAKRGAVTADNDLSFNMAAGNNFSCTTAGSGTLTFTNITAGQSGFILLVNASNHAIAAAATTKITAADLSRISQTGTYTVSYFAANGNVYCSASGNLA